MLFTTINDGIIVDIIDGGWRFPYHDKLWILKPGLEILNAYAGGIFKVDGKIRASLSGSYELLGFILAPSLRLNRCAA